MKALIAVAVAAAFAVPAYAQQKSDSTLPSAQERQSNREAVREGAHDAALTTKVKTALAKDAGFKTLANIDVDSSKDGVVTLKGHVESAEAKKKAETIAKQVSGVKSVKNQLKIEKKG